MILYILLIHQEICFPFLFLCPSLAEVKNLVEDSFDPELSTQQDRRGPLDIISQYVCQMCIVKMANKVVFKYYMSKFCANSDASHLA